MLVYSSDGEKLSGRGKLWRHPIAMAVVRFSISLVGVFVGALLYGNPPLFWAWSTAFLVGLSFFGLSGWVFPLVALGESEKFSLRWVFRTFLVSFSGFRVALAVIVSSVLVSGYLREAWWGVGDIFLILFFFVISGFPVVKSSRR